MFAGAIHLTPGRDLRIFEVRRNGEHRTGSGRIVSNGNEIIGTVRAILAAAKPEEIERWRQLQHTVSHKIIQQGTAPFEIKPGDSLLHGNRRYIVQTQPYDPGGLHHWTVYYCEERGDI